MCDFDLSDALEGSPELEDGAFESRCFDMTEVQDEIFKLHEGQDLVVSRNQMTMQCVVKLLLAVNRMKKLLTCCSTEHSDHELCSVLMDSLLDETVVQTTESFSTGVTRGKFERADSENMCTLCDTSHKDIVHGSGEIKLQAITLKGGHLERKVNFKLSRYFTMCASAGDGQSVALSITDTNLHLSCSMKDGRASLNLEECSRKDLQTISCDGNMDRFLFYKRTTGICHTTFESVKCRGWFISTSYEGENQPVEMCQADTSRRLTYFKLN